MSDPIPLTTDGTGPKGAIPVALYGAGGGGGGSSTSDAITMEGFPPEAEANGMTLTDFLMGFMQFVVGDLVNRIEALESLAQTTEAVTIEGLHPEADGMLLNDYIREFSNAMVGLTQRIEALESEDDDGPIY